MEYKNLKVISNPIVNQSLCTMRNKNTDTEGVRLAARKLTRILVFTYYCLFNWYESRRIQCTFSE